MLSGSSLGTFDLGWELAELDLGGELAEGKEGRNMGVCGLRGELSISTKMF